MNGKKFSDPFLTAKGEARACVSLRELETLWFNTGTQCNLSCENCYIESSPQNDRLSFLNAGDVRLYLDEIQKDQLPVKEIGFTGGEPFLNPHMIEILTLCLERGFKTLVLTNAYRLINRYKKELLELSAKHADLLLIRVSLDHYKQEIHENERGPKTFIPTMQSLSWLSENKVPLAIAGRTLTGEDPNLCKEKYRELFHSQKITIDCDDPEKFVTFPEMNPTQDVPEITKACWGILGKKPDDIMCSNSRMVVKRKGEIRPKVLACTLLAYESEFELGETLAGSKKEVQLNHPFCSQFCVLGGASCS